MDNFQEISEKLQTLKFVDAILMANREFDKYTNVFAPKHRCILSKTRTKIILDGTLVFKANYVTNKTMVPGAAYFKPVKTSGGIMYYMRPADSDNVPDGLSELADTIYCFTAHVFDRYAQRSNVDMSRKQALEKFFGDYITDAPICTYDNNGSMKMYTLDGLLLGNYKIVDGKRLVLIKTYVSTEMLRDTQKKMLSESVAALENEIVWKLSDDYYYSLADAWLTRTPDETDTRERLKTTAYTIFHHMNSKKYKIYLDKWRKLLTVV